MNPLNRRNVKRSEDVSDRSSQLSNSPQLSGDARSQHRPARDSKISASNSNTAKFSRGSIQHKLRGKELVDANNLNRDVMTPSTIIVTRAQLHGHGEVPYVESTDMGPVMYCQLVIEDGDVNALALIATEDSVTVNKPELAVCINLQVKRLEVGTEGRIPLIDHDFESGEEIKVNGERVHSIFVDGGVNDTLESCEATGPTLVAVFKDRPSITNYQVGHIRLEMKPHDSETPIITPLGTNFPLKKRRYFQVFQCPRHHHHI